MRFIAVLGVLAIVAGSRVGSAAPPATQKGLGKLPFVQFDARKKEVRVECEAVRAEAALEFFVCAVNSNEHEAVLRSAAKASHINFALLAMGLQPGEPAHYQKVLDKWVPPHGPPLNLRCEFEKDNKTVSVPAYRMMRNMKTKKEMPPLTWVFTGSRTMEDGKFAADVTGYLVSLVNFDLTLIDVPDIKSADNTALEWEINPDLVPPRGTKVVLIIEPAGKVQAPTTQAVSAAGAAAGVADAGNARPEAVPPTTRLSEVAVDEARVKAMKELWTRSVAPHRQTLAQAAQTHYEVINALRREQNRLIDEANRIERVIEELQKEYQDMTTPRPELKD